MGSLISYTSRSKNKKSIFSLINRYRMKIILNLVLLLFSYHAISQSRATLYFDNNLQPVSKKKAIFYGTGEMENGLFKLNLFYQKLKGNVAYEGYFTDSSRKVRAGNLNRFFANGTLLQKGSYLNGKKDGFWISYRTTGLVSEQVLYNEGLAENVTLFHDLPAIHQRVVTVDDMVNNTFQYTLYDAQNLVIGDEKIVQDFSAFAFEPDTTALFGSKEEDWEKYTARAIKIQKPKLKKADFGEVLVRFVVDAEGKVIDVKPLSDTGSKLAEKVIFALQKSPRWKPAQHNGKAVSIVKYHLFSKANPARGPY